MRCGPTVTLADHVVGIRITCSVSYLPAGDHDVMRGRVELAVAAYMSRCQMVRPLLAGMVLAPASAAKAASLRQQPWCDQDTMACAALTGPMPTLVNRWVGCKLHPVGIVAGQHQRAQPVDHPGLVADQLPARAQQNAQCFLVTISSRCRQPVGIQPQGGQRGQPGVDRSDLPPRRLRWWGVPFPPRQSCCLKRPG